MKSLLFFLLGVALTVGAIFFGQKVYASSPTQTRIYIPWITGSDAGYTSLLMVQNTSMDPYGTTAAATTCTADAYATNAGTVTHSSGTLGTLAAGNLTVFTEAQLATATGLSLANGGQRAYLFLTCDQKYVHAQTLFVNPGGIVTFAPGYIVPPNRSLGTGPEQLLQ